jgi:hypothetical protein
MIRGEGQPFGVEVIDGQVSVGMNDDGPRSFFDGLRVPNLDGGTSELRC